MKYRIYCFDLDGVITLDELCADKYPQNKVEEWDKGQWEEYFKWCKPNKQVIEKMFFLHKQGGSIKIYTARNSKFTEITVKWLKRHLVYYDDIRFNKPFADIYIDDKGLKYCVDDSLNNI